MWHLENHADCWTVITNVIDTGNSTTVLLVVDDCQSVVSEFHSGSQVDKRTLIQAVCIECWHGGGSRMSHSDSMHNFSLPVFSLAKSKSYHSKHCKSSRGSLKFDSVLCVGLISCSDELQGASTFISLTDRLVQKEKMEHDVVFTGTLFGDVAVCIPIDPSFFILAKSGEFQYVLSLFHTFGCYFGGHPRLGRDM